MASQKFMAESVEVSFYDGTDSFVIPPVLLGEVKFSDKDDTTTIETQGGKFSKPANKPDGTVSANVYLPTISYLGPLLGSNYTVAVDGDGGKLVSKIAACTGSTSGALHIHPICNADDRDDIHVYSATPMLDTEITFNEKGDPQQAMVTFLIGADEDGNRYFMGRDDVTAAKKYDPATNTWTAVTGE